MHNLPLYAIVGRCMTDANRTPHPAPIPDHPPHPRHQSADRKESIRSIMSTLAVLLIAPIIAFVLTAFVFQSYQVDGESMEPTLSHNDRLLVWKLPKTWSRITDHAYIPKRGDVVVFTEAGLAQFGQDPKKQLIKRVVGLPGEKVTVRDGNLTVFNDEFPEGFQPDSVLPYGEVIGRTPTDGEWTMAKDQLFVVGDNRDNSLDSRIFGPIDAHNIVGKLSARVLPINEMKKF